MIAAVLKQYSNYCVYLFAKGKRKHDTGLSMRANFRLVSPKSWQGSAGSVKCCKQCPLVSYCCHSQKLKHLEGEAWVKGISDIGLSQKNQLGRVKTDSIFLIGSVWIPEFNFSFCLCSKNGPQKNVPANAFQWKAGVFFNNLILNVYLKRLELIKVVMRARKRSHAGCTEQLKGSTTTCSNMSIPASAQQTQDVRHSWTLSGVFFCCYHS